MCVVSSSETLDVRKEEGESGSDVASRGALEDSPRSEEDQSPARPVRRRVSLPERPTNRSVREAYPSGASCGTEGREVDRDRRESVDMSGELAPEWEAEGEAEGEARCSSAGEEELEWLRFIVVSCPGSERRAIGTTRSEMERSKSCVDGARCNMGTRADG
jgi:hypothetical protein